jgi:hypothetical protein
VFIVSALDPVLRIAVGFGEKSYDLVRSARWLDGPRLHDLNELTELELVGNHASLIALRAATAQARMRWWVATGGGSSATMTRRLPQRMHFMRLSRREMAKSRTLKQKARNHARMRSRRFLKGGGEGDLSA